MHCDQGRKKRHAKLLVGKCSRPVFKTPKTELFIQLFNTTHIGYELNPYLIPNIRATLKSQPQSRNVLEVRV
jgi:hypothetical protein